MASTNLDTIPGQRGSLVIAEDGAIIQSNGELQNDEKTAAIMLQMMKNSVKLIKSVNGERKSNVQRLSVAYKNYSLVASIWNHKVYVVKRINPET
ncbi:PREDICTED: ragulator complex protein LAMTOR4 homolog [Amphimedon queenslandica]|uniref:Late endosomal/lysosomal adaptor and MAPK and MTOR activator 4 n=1 Tax=Amphimedon queenslandica TaxID=400682 RepID=I1ENH7_AMPQE|nr:PREDICTED: ragulator complex protein LAMTOR4 homolog [Amphimedon queenslandica]XP_003391361.1 PREDICTED: ragulator complex protein LAMTOR4 homolog [Amphimedon queenslandica]|eukprot:XP_003391063.1 PREDICTED: ragulator complex protein LAMTOR4 homolog [Amphimedon queenslandica]